MELEVDGGRKAMHAMAGLTLAGTELQQTNLAAKNYI